MRLSIRQYALALLDFEEGTETGKMHAASEGFVAWLARRGEGKKLKAIVREAERIAGERAGIVNVQVSTAHPADVATQTLLRSRAERMFPGKKVVASFVTDETLIGGALIRSEELLYDMSLSGGLKELEKTLMR